MTNSLFKEAESKRDKSINVQELDIDLIDSVNTFQERFEVASKALDAFILQHIQSAMVAQRIQMTDDEARTLWPRIKRFRAIEGREPNVHSADALEKTHDRSTRMVKDQEG